MDKNQQAQHYLTAYQQGYELEGGWAFNKALRNLQLDYSLDSIGRIDALLYRLASTFSESQLQETDKNNTFLLLGFYLGDFIAKRCQQPINWYSRASLPSARDIADGFESQVIALIGERVFMPLKVIHDLLFVDDEQQPNCLQLVDFYCQQQSVASNLLNAHEHYHHWMECFFSDQDLPGGLFYRELLKQTFPDFTLDSLTRLDQLLQDIRTLQQPSYDELVNQAGGHNFLLLIAYYLCTTIARAGELPLHWLSYEEVKLKIPDLPLEFETSRACHIANGYYFPLALLSDILFGSPSKGGCHDYATKLLREVRRESQAHDMPRPSSNISIRQIMESNPLWIDMLKQTGSLASHGLFMISGGNALVPTLLTPTSRGKFFRQLNYQSANAAQEQGLQELNQNPNQLPYQALLYQGYYTAYNKQCDALLLLLRGYQGAPLQLSIALPFRHPSHPQGFGIYNPKLLESNLDIDLYPALFQLFYQGIDELDLTAFDYSWSKYNLGEA